MMVVIKLLVGVILLGYATMWTMMPIITYRKHWYLRATAKSTYYGAQGETILTYTIPVLLVAVLGCVHLHLAKKLNYKPGERIRKNRLDFLKRPVLVKGPLGIISGIELAFFMMFIALLVWSFSIYLHNMFQNITPQFLAMFDNQKMWEAKMGAIALTLGIIGNICLALLFAPVTRGSSILPLFGLTSESSIRYHIWLGHISMVLFTAHGIIYIMSWAASHKISKMLEWSKTRISNVAGEISLLAGLFMWVTTIPRIRQKMFELFFYTHYFYILFMIFFILHVGISYSCIMLPGFYLFLIDRYLRFLQSQQRARLVSARVLPCETVELNFSKNLGLSYTPTSIVFVNVPSISKLQWHPFTINSNSNLEPENLSVIIKNEGSWSQKLYQILSSPSVEQLDVSIEGPYGPASTHFLRYETLVMISGGSGITPFISIIRELIFIGRQSESKTPKVLLICAFKNSSELTMLDLMLPLSGPCSSTFPTLDIKIEAYVTREKHPVKKNNPKLLRTMWFKPRISDTPISATLGPNSWLWLAAIILSSFTMFLILIAILNRYYIYPIDHNTYMIYPSSSRALLNMVIICVCIAIGASWAFLWSKKQNAKKGKEVKDMGKSFPVMSHKYNGDRELESLPQQSLVQAPRVHYGERPNLTKMLCECKGSSAGVLVCGPKNMRHEVATICSSSSADNLHFESISFSW